MQHPPVAPIAVQPFVPVDRTEIVLLEQLIVERFAAAVRVLDPAPISADAFVADRGQFDADVVLEALFDRLPERCLRIIGVTDEDLFIAGRTFVFGYAHLTDGMALYSIKRLREAFYGRRGDETLERERVHRAVVHELGHTFGVPHCEAAACCMRAVAQVDSLDALSPDYCPACAPRIEEGLAVAPWSARGRFERGMAHYRRRRFTRAREELRHAVRSAPLDVRYRQAFELAAAAAGEESDGRQPAV
jgi:archaemetzincin